MPSPAEVTETYRQANLALRAGMLRDLLRLWPALDWANLADTYPAWLAATANLIDRERALASGLAAGYLEAFRGASGVTGTEPVLAGPAVAEQVATSMRVTSLVAYRVARRAGMSPAQSIQSAFVQSSGAASRLALDAGRDTVLATARADGARWRRVTSANACDFCVMLAARGAVYREDTAGFRSHDHCACIAEPIYAPRVTRARRRGGLTSAALN